MKNPTLPGLSRRLYLFSFVDEFGPLYTLYTLWFADNGIGTAKTSIVFLVWAAVGILLEVPSGALADRIDKRKLVAFALGLRAVGISLWLVWPTYGGIMVGAILWSAHSALASGAWEALVYEQLDDLEKSQEYPRVMARIGQFSNGGIALGTVLAIALLKEGASLAILGWITVAIHVASVSLLFSTPRAMSEFEARASFSYRQWWMTLRTGLRSLRESLPVSKLIVIGALLEGLFIVDEYVPILARLRGASDSLVPFCVLAVWVGLLLGGELAARRPKLHPKWLSAILIVGMLISALGLILESVLGLALLGVGYATLEATRVISDARMQAHVKSDIRATVTSVRSFLSNSISLGAFVVIGLFTQGDEDPSNGLLVVMGVILITGILIWRWLPLHRMGLLQD